MKSNLLSARKVESINKPGAYCDGGGLYLRVSDSGTKAWVFKFMLNRRARAMGLGRVRDFTLAEARERAREARRLVADGIDPIDAKQSKRDAALAAAAKRVTFREAAQKFLAAHSAKWTNPRHEQQWRNTLEQHAYPVLADLPVDMIAVEHVIAVLEPMWAGRQVTASRLRGRIKNVLGYATVHKWRYGDNPARWKGHLATVFGNSHKAEAHAALPVADVPAFMKQLREGDRVQSRALEFLILTATRESEARLAKWSEVDAATWTIPAERMKARKEHVVPLCKRAIEILNSLPRNGDRVFAVGDKAMSKELARLLPKGTSTVHGLRSTFRDWAGDHTSFDREVIEHALAHKLPDKAEAAYRRSTALQKRRLLMEAWSGYCAGEHLGGNVYKLSNK
jgi:integrase